MAERYQVRGRRIWDSETDTYSMLFREKKYSDYWMERLNSNTCVITDIVWKRLDQWDDNEPVEQPASDPVNNPSHYTQGSVECIDAIEAALPTDQFIGFLRGQVIKYAWRLGLKGEAVEDARKGTWYFTRLVKTLEK